MESERTIYLLLTRSTTIPSRLIHLATRADYTHVSLGLDGPAGPFYSFARKYPRLPLPGGFVIERPGAGYYALHPQTPCCLYVLFVPRPVYNRLRHIVQWFAANRALYHYNLLGLFGCLFSVGTNREHHYFCSEFVAMVLQGCGAVKFEKKLALVEPRDFTDISGAVLKYSGPVGDRKSVV